MIIEAISAGSAVGAVVLTGYIWINNRSNKEKTCIKQDVQELKTRTAIIETNVDWIKTYLLKNGSK